MNLLTLPMTNQVKQSIFNIMILHVEAAITQNLNRKKNPPNTNYEYLLFTCMNAFICRRTEIVKASSKTVIIIVIVIIIIVVVAVIIIAIIIINIDRVVCGGDVER